MASPTALVLRAPGTNCDVETCTAFERAGANVQTLHVNQLIQQPGKLAEFQILCIPGGFSYGDDIAAGRILAQRLHRQVGDSLHQFRDRGSLILGICNGFQVLMKTDLLDTNTVDGPTGTLAFNDSARFVDRWVNLRVEPSDCVFLAGIERIQLPIAHAEGKFVPARDEILTELTETRRLPLRYADGDYAPTANYPSNPNGSIDNVAGMCDATGHVLGLMPHPERFIDATQHPQWTRKSKGDKPGDGLAIFRNAARYFS